MIVFKFYGLDQFVVGDYSRENTPNLAKLCEVNEDEIMFYAPNSFLFHKGMDQTSWNVIIEVCLPHKFHQLEENIKKYIFSTLSEVAIHIHVLFNFFEEGHLSSQYNNKYPKFITEDNSVNIDECCHEHEELSEEDLLDEEKVYTGNAFKDLKNDK